MDAKDFLPDEATLAVIRQEIAAYEQERAAVHRQVAWRAPVLIGLVLIAVILIAIGFNRFADPHEQWVSPPHVFLYVGAVVVALSAYFWATRPANRLRHSFRSRLLPIIFGFIDGVRYSRGKEPETFERLPRDAIGTFNRETFDDVVSGSYGGFAFELYEARFLHKTGKADMTSFHGVVVAFETETSFPGLLIATRKGTQVVSFFGGIFGGDPLETVRSGVPALDEEYDFRTDNPSAALPLVEGRLARALQWLGESWPDEPARVALQQANGFLLLPTSKDFFELPSISSPLDYKLHVQPIIADMASLLAIASLVRKIGDATEETLPPPDA